MGKEADIRIRALVPRPWWQVGLTVLPGLVGLLVSACPSSVRANVGLRFLVWAALALLILSSVLRAVVRRCPFEVGVRGIIPLGLLAGWGVMSATGSLHLVYQASFVLLAATGLLFAPRNGLGAGLFLLTGGMIVAGWEVEPVIYFWDSPFWRTFVSDGEAVLFLVVTPVWVLRSRSIAGQAVALLLPVAAYCAGLVCALSSVRGLPVSHTVYTAEPFIVLFATVGIAAAVYGWLASRDRWAGQAEGAGAVQRLTT